jgi:hypothetical protein
LLLFLFIKIGHAAAGEVSQEMGVLAYFEVYFLFFDIYYIFKKIFYRFAKY